MKYNILITGGAGFIGSHLADKLLHSGHRVRILDRLIPQVHGPESKRPDYLSKGVELIIGDIRDAGLVEQAIKGIDVIYHFGAAVGVGQSMYQICHYSEVNAIGTATVMEALARQPVERLIVASSMSIYGEGLYRNSMGETVENAFRSIAQLKAHQWEPIGPDEESLIPIPTPEHKIPAVPSVYALSKYYQERLCLNVAPAYGICTVALRFFNVFGPRQALSNPYTGVLAIFASRLLNDKPPVIHEDGKQFRDFVYIKDVVQACMLALEAPEIGGQVLNIGSGRHLSILEVARILAKFLGKSVAPEISGKYRVGDIRNCFADISLAREVLSYNPSYTLESGIAEMAEWLSTQHAEDRLPAATRELASRGLAA